MLVLCRYLIVRLYCLFCCQVTLAYLLAYILHLHIVCLQFNFFCVFLCASHDVVYIRILCYIFIELYSTVK